MIYPRPSNIPPNVPKFRYDSLELANVWQNLSSVQSPVRLDEKLVTCNVHFPFPKYLIPISLYTRTCPFHHVCLNKDLRPDDPLSMLSSSFPSPPYSSSYNDEIVVGHSNASIIIFKLDSSSWARICGPNWTNTRREQRMRSLGRAGYAMNSLSRRKRERERQSDCYAK